MSRYFAIENPDRKQKYTGQFAWMVKDYREMVPVAYCHTKEMAENFAEQMNKNGYIEQEEPPIDQFEVCEYEDEAGKSQ